MADVRYPEDRSTFIRELPERSQRFAEAREEFLLSYGYNTARAYWGDLEHLYDWCEARGFEIFGLTEQQFQQYQALLRRRNYSENTIRRRMTAWRGFKDAESRLAFRIATTGGPSASFKEGLHML